MAIHARARCLTILLAALLGCGGSAALPAGEAVTLRLTSAEPSRQVRVAIEVEGAGGGAEVRGNAVRPSEGAGRWEADTPAEVVLPAGTRQASLARVGGAGELRVAATAGGVRLWAQGRDVLLVATARGLELERR